MHRQAMRSVESNASRASYSAVRPWRLIAPRIASAQDACSNVSTLAKSLRQTTIVSSKAVPGGPEAQRCRRSVKCTRRFRRSSGSHIGAVYRLPANWNGKVLGHRWRRLRGQPDAAGRRDVVSSRGYAVIQNDLGHDERRARSIRRSRSRRPASRNVEGDHRLRSSRDAPRDRRSASDVVVELLRPRAAARAIGRAARPAARQGLAEVQRYPDDYDGVIAGAPVYTPLVYSNAILQGAGLSLETREATCCPRTCRSIQKARARRVRHEATASPTAFSPIRARARGIRASSRAKRAASAECLTHAQVETVRRVYAGVKTKDGAVRRDAADARRRERLGRAHDRHA